MLKTGEEIIMNSTNINTKSPSVNTNFIEALQTDLDQFQNQFSKKGIVAHSSILKIIFDELEVIDIKDEPEFDAEKDKIGYRHYLVSCIQELIRVSQMNGFGICSHEGKVYMYNGEFWKQVRKRDFEKFLSDAAIKMGVCKFISRHFSEKSQDEFIPSKELYEEYKTYCFNEEMHYLTYKNFIQRLREIDLRMVRNNRGLAVFCQRVSLENIDTCNTSNTKNTENG